MCAVVSTLFYVMCFPHQGKVVTIDQLAFFHSDARTGNVPFISKTPPGYENIGVGLLKDSSLMGTFSIPPPDVPHPFVTPINMISTSVHGTLRLMTHGWYPTPSIIFVMETKCL
jgi:hypothetical protein